ncbi:glucosidase II beta subunit-like protein [Diplocarpon rosae]|nr:glucosidase II beta subunit-like protein [Diplocarpon rosae]
MPVPARFRADENGVTKVVAWAQSKERGGKAMVTSNEDFEEIQVDPKLFGSAMKKMEKLAKGRLWKIEVVDGPGGKL